MTTAYLAGPMRGIPGFNTEAFHQAAQALADRYTIVNPAAHDQETWNALHHDRADAWNAGIVPEDLAAWLADQFRWDIRHITSVDAVILLPGWRSSTGATLEALVATVCGVPLLCYTDGDTRPLPSADRQHIDTILRRLTDAG